MPELPEVETTCRALNLHLPGRQLQRVHVHQPRLRWPLERGFAGKLAGRHLLRLSRRAKYLLFHFDMGVLLVHLGMSGHLRLFTRGKERIRPHDHVRFHFQGGWHMHYNDPRRFGSMHWIQGDPGRHFLLAELGPEPLQPGFDGTWLHAQSRRRRIAVKTFIMDSRVVTGVGNIYANEALFQAGIHPARAAGRISHGRMERLAQAITDVLSRAIDAGGTTLRDYVDGQGIPGYFGNQLSVYGREQEPCLRCARRLCSVRIAGRSTVYCPGCQR